MPPPFEFISETTYLDLSGYAYDEFVRELILAHAILQSKATGNTKSLTLFKGQTWWFQIDSGRSNTVSREFHSKVPEAWICLQNSAVYDKMVDVFCNIYGDDRPTLTITNDLNIVTHHYDPLALLYPNHAPPYFCPLSADEDPTPVFPVVFTIRRVPKVNLPTMLSLPPLQTTTAKPRNETLSNPSSSQRKQLVVRLQGKPPMVLLQREQPQEPVQREPPYMHPTKVPSHGVPPQAVSIEQRMPLPLLRRTAQKTQLPSARAKEPSVPNKKQMPDFLISRPASKINRRYSIPFDRFVVGVNGDRRQIEELENDWAYEIYECANRPGHTSATFPGKKSFTITFGAPNMNNGFAPTWGKLPSVRK